MTDSVHSARYKKLCELLIAARKSSKLSQETLAQKLGWIQTAVSKYERGERRLDVVEFLEVATALKIDIQKAIRQILAVDGKRQ